MKIIITEEQSLNLSKNFVSESKSEKIPLSTYQKLYSEILLSEFPDIERLEVLKPNFPFSVLMGVKINFYMKPADQIVQRTPKGLFSCRYLIGMLKGRINELNKYMTSKMVVDMNIYFEGELLCHDILNW